MTEMMRQCWNWMMSLGWLGMLGGAVLLVGLFVLVVFLIRQVSRTPRA